MSHIIKHDEISAKHTLWTLLQQFRVEIPLIQRDYAQGRERALPIREKFLKKLLDALCAEDETYTALELDFVYGKVVLSESGDATQSQEVQKTPCLHILDGQQRLTTLYLLHWFCAMREGCLDKAAERLKRFSYEVRPSSRDFCAFLCSPQFSESLPMSSTVERVRPLSQIIKNRKEYIPAWDRDASIQGMLTTLDDIETLFNVRADLHASSLFEKLTDELQPRIVFSFLQLNNQEFDLSDSLYITMNSRGKLLTDFENFKSEFLTFLHEEYDETVRCTISRAFDVDWTDLFWKELTRKEHKAAAMDAAFQRYIDYVMLMLKVWSSDDVATHKTATEQIYNQTKGRDSLDLACAVFLKTETNTIFPKTGGNLTFLRQSLTCWHAIQQLHGSVEKAFHHLFPFPLFFCDPDPFTRITTGEQESMKVELMFFAFCIVLLKQAQPHDAIILEGYKRILRSVRNLIHYSDDLIRAENMPHLLNDVFRIIHTGTIDLDMHFNKDQIREEISKQKFYSTNPALLTLLWKLEDHDLLQGRLALFADEKGEFVPAVFEQNGQTFLLVFSDYALNDTNFLEILERALLTVGDYTQKIRWDGRWQFAIPRKEIWRELLTSSQREEFAKTKMIITKLLFKLASCVDLSAILKKNMRLIKTWLAGREKAKHFCWRYYFIKYPAMRAGKSGIYLWENDFDLSMLEGVRLSGYYRDPYLWTVFSHALGEDHLYEHDLKMLWFKGADKSPVTITGIGDLWCCETGWKLTRQQGGQLAHIELVRKKFKIGSDNMLTIRQTIIDDNVVDRKDRILAGSALIKALLS